MTQTNTAHHHYIFLAGQDPVAAFAAEELCAYLQRMTGEAYSIIPGIYPGESLNGIWLGCFEDFPRLDRAAGETVFDDAILVDIAGGQGLIAGLNGRSTLLGVYRFLSELGCRWLRPGAEGEFIPRQSLEGACVRLDERPSYRHRAICIEGAVSLENVLDVIAWAPKVGLSGYFMQFREGHTFFERWYAHTHNPVKISSSISLETAREYTRQVEAALAKRGMLYHAVGHGWTCEAFGIPGLGWDPVIQDWPEEVTTSLALVNGRRAMWYDIPLITSLCFSNPTVRQKVVGCVVDYVQVHRNIQALHFWLDDGFNNKCECAECQKMRPSDYYVMLLNELDAALAEIDYPGKVVFLAYADLLWAPQVHRIHNPQRFILMFAPITRSYRRMLHAATLEYPLPAFERNRLVFSDNNDEQLAFLRSWQALFSGDSFIYDYHLWRPGAYVCDPDGVFLAGLLSADIKNLKALGLDGMVSCQIQRFFFPTGLAMYVLGRTLWDDSLSFDDLLDDYFAHAFGPDWEACRAYLRSLSGLQDVVPVTEKGLSIAPDAPAALQEGLETIRRFTSIVEKNLDLPETCQARSWFYLKIHAELMRRYLRLLSARAAGDAGMVRRIWEDIKGFLCVREDDLQPVFDVYAFIDTFDKHFVQAEA